MKSEITAFTKKTAATSKIVVEVGSSSISQLKSTEINENNIDIVICNVLDQFLKEHSLEGQEIAQGDKDKDSFFAAVKSINTYVQKNKRKFNNTQFAKSLRTLPTNNLFDSIETSLIKADNPLRLVLNLWNIHFSKKYLSFNKHSISRGTLIGYLSNDIHYSKKMFTSLIQNIYRDWINQFDEGNVEDNISISLIPDLLTNNNLYWKEVYDFLNGNFGKLKLKFDRSHFINDPSFFDVNKYFSGSQANCSFPYATQAIIGFCKETSLYAKSELILNIIHGLTKDTEDHQELLISKGMIEQKKKLDTDNIVSCLEYCLLLANEDISFHLNILQMFYPDSFFDVLGYGHFIASLMTADSVLKNRDEKGKLEESSTSSDNSSILMHKEMNGVIIRMSSIRFNPVGKFGHCFKFQTLKWARMLDITWVSLFSDRPLRSPYSFAVKIHGTNNVKLGIYLSDPDKQRSRDYSDSKESVTLCLRNGMLYDRGEIIKAFVPPEEKIELVDFAIGNGVFCWRNGKTKELLAIVDLKQAPNANPEKEKLFQEMQKCGSPGSSEILQKITPIFHAVLASGAEIEII